MGWIEIADWRLIGNQKSCHRTYAWTISALRTGRALPFHASSRTLQDCLGSEPKRRIRRKALERGPNGRLPRCRRALRGANRGLLHGLAHAISGWGRSRSWAGSRSTAWFIRTSKGKACCVNWHAAVTSFPMKANSPLCLERPNRAAYAGNIGALNWCHVGNTLELVTRYPDVAPQDALDPNERTDGFAIAPTRIVGMHRSKGLSA